MEKHKIEKGCYPKKDDADLKTNQIEFLREKCDWN